MPAAARASSSRRPAGPTNGSPSMSSLSPGCSPTSMSSAFSPPSPNTVWVALRYRSQAVHPAASWASSARVTLFAYPMVAAGEPFGPLARSTGMRRAAVLLAVAVATMLVMIGGTAEAADRAVSIKDFAFNPKDITIDAGDTVVWSQNDSAAHTVTADDG